MRPNAKGLNLQSPANQAARVVLALTLGLPCASSLASDRSIAGELRSAIQPLPHASTTGGACVIDLRSGETLFAWNADTPLIPASSHKVFAMAVALVELGPAFHFETVLATRGDRLIVIGDGDPGFGDPRLCKNRDEAVTAELERWALAIKASGDATGFSGLVIDESIFDNLALHTSWEQDDLGKWYAAPVGGLNFNDNCLDITVSPAPQTGDPVLVQVQPPNGLAQILNRCKTGGKGNPLLHHAPGTVEYKITGRCSKRWPFGSVAFPDPGLLFAGAFRSVLDENEITIGDDIRRERFRLPDGRLPESLHVIARHRTPIADVLSRAGKNSQNLFAECLLKRTGFAWSKRTGSPIPVGSWASGTQAVTAMMRSAGVDTTGFTVADGSGLSRENTCTARQQASLLAWAINSTWGHLLHDNLSVAGVDGSLRKRLRDAPGRVFAKTGTMTGVRSLAGYVDDDRGPRYAFAITFNGYRGPSTPYKLIQDDFCRTLLKRQNQAAKPTN